MSEWQNIYFCSPELVGKIGSLAPLPCKIYASDRFAEDFWIGFESEDELVRFVKAGTDALVKEYDKHKGE
jgi:hypothetical protein